MGLPITRKLFLFFLVVATVVPFIVTGLIASGFTFFGIHILFIALFTLAGAHVPATFYLLSDSNIRKLFYQHKIRFIVIPILIILISFVVLTFASEVEAFLFILLYITYQAWHYGKQNVGVLVFSRLADKKPAIQTWHRRLITAGIIAGILGSFEALRPSYTLDGSVFTFNFSWLSSWNYVSYNLGFFLIVVVGLISFLQISTVIRTAGFLHTLLFLSTTLFFLPIFLSRQPIITFASYATAHGLQYLVFLGFHAWGRKGPHGESLLKNISWPLYLITIALGIIYVLAPYAISEFNGRTFELILGHRLPDSQNIRSAFGIFIGITTVHFWVDQTLWRMRDPDRRAWLLDRYAYLIRA